MEPLQEPPGDALLEKAGGQMLLERGLARSRKAASSSSVRAVPMIRRLAGSSPSELSP